MLGRVALVQRHERWGGHQLMAGNRSEETRWRRIALDLGYRVESSHRHDSRAMSLGSYRLVDVRTNRIVVPEKPDDTGYGAGLAEIATFLRAAFRAPSAT
jgi:hypothetical protein